MKYLALVFGACLGLAGCVVETGSGGNGGSGGSGAEGGGGSGAEGGGGSGVGGNTTTSEGGGGAGGGECISCGVYITPGEEGELCDGESSDLYDALATCVCGTDLMGAGAKCYEDCAASSCAAASPDAGCLACIQDTNAGCGTEFNECSNDI